MENDLTGANRWEVMIKLVVFDLWKTLVYKDVPHSTVAKIHEEMELEVDLKSFTKNFERIVETKGWDSKYDAYKALCEGTDIEATDENVDKIIHIRDSAELKTLAFPHTVPMLKQLKEKGYKLGLISNSTVFSVEAIEKLGFLSIIDHKVFSFDVGFAKPDQRIFEKMLELSGCRADETVMVGDNFDYDVKAARDVGINAIHFKSWDQLKQEFGEFNIRLN
jgi:putative hydrolase of the HAD superfamily